MSECAHNMFWAFAFACFFFARDNVKSGWQSSYVSLCPKNAVVPLPILFILRKRKPVISPSSLPQKDDILSLRSNEFLRQTFLSRPERRFGGALSSLLTGWEETSICLIRTHSELSILKQEILLWARQFTVCYKIKNSALSTSFKSLQITSVLVYFL